VGDDLADARRRARGPADPALYTGRASGEFHRAWTSAEDWERVQITADQCPRISAAHLAAERIRLGDALYRQEYFGAFVAAPGSVFDAEVVAHMFGDAWEDEPDRLPSRAEGALSTASYNEWLSSILTKPPWTRSSPPGRPLPYMPLRAAKRAVHPTTFRSTCSKRLSSSCRSASRLSSLFEKMPLLL
jgi:hypothetical protein